MRNLKRVLSLALAALMLMGMMVVGAGAASKDFTDADEIKNVEAVDVMVALGVLEGGDKGDFQPNSILTREQAAKIICYLLLGEESAEKLTTNYAIFSDVPANRWSAPYISYCVNLGILAGDGAGHFYPEGKLTGVAFAKMLLVCLGYSADREQYVGNNWEINTSAAAISSGIAPKALDLSKELSRQDAAQMAFNTLQATMVEYLNDNTIIIGDTTVSTVGKATAVKQSPYTDTMDTENLQFAEKYFGGLKKVPATDAFERPAISWRNNAKLIGTYTLASDLTYTAAVEAGEIYADLGLSKAKATNGYYVDGKEQTAVTLRKGNDGDVFGANGVLTQVWYDEHEDGTSTLTITEINTYVGKVNTVTKATSSYDRYVTLSKAFIAPASLNTKFETENFEKGDLVTYTAAWNESDKRYEIQTVDVLEKTTTGILTEWNGSTANLGNPDKASADNNFTVDGETYEYSINAYIVDENGFGSKTDISAFDVDKSELNIYLDQYGYAIYVSGVEGETNYAAVIGFGESNQYGSETRGATLLLPDGTTKEVIAKLSTGLNWDMFTTQSYSDVQKNLVTDGLADLVTYSVGDDGIYTLSFANTTAAKYDTTYTNPSDSNGDGVVDGIHYVTFVNGKSLFDLVSSTSGKDKTLYTTSETIFMVATDNGSKKTYSVYTGYENMPSLDVTKGVDGIAYICNKNYPTQIDVVYLDVDNLAGISSVDTYVVKQANADIITNSKGDYYVLPAIVDGAETTVMISADYQAATAIFTKKDGTTTRNFEDAYGLYALNNVTKNSNGIITGFSVVNGTVFNAEDGARGTVAANKVVLGLNGKKNTATYWAYNDKTSVYVVDKDYKTITVSSVADVDTDSNDLVYASHDGGSPEKKLNDVIIVKQDDQILSNDTTLKDLKVKDTLVKASADAGVDYEVVLPYSKASNTTTVQNVTYTAATGTVVTGKWGTALNSMTNTLTLNACGNISDTTYYFELTVTAADTVTTDKVVIKVMNEAAPTLGKISSAANITISDATLLAPGSITITSVGAAKVSDLKAALVVPTGFTMTVVKNGSFGSTVAAADTDAVKTTTTPGLTVVLTNNVTGTAFDYVVTAS